jgi:transcriptional regulator with XRE-family HTH domain
MPKAIPKSLPRGDVIKRLDQHADDFRKLYYHDRLSLRDVAFRMGVSLGYLSKWADLRGMPKRSLAEAAQNRGIRDDDVREVIRLRLQKQLTLKEISTLCGYESRSSVHKVLKEVGLDGKLKELPTWEEWLEFVRQSAQRSQQTEDGQDAEAEDEEEDGE